MSRGHALPEPEREALAAVAAWACQFTPRVSLEPPQGIAAEVEGSLRFFGGFEPLKAKLQQGLTDLGFKAAFAFAPTARASHSAARGGRLEALPVAVTGLAPEALELLGKLGIGTIGALLRLPREGVARRFGQDLLEEIDQAGGKAPEAREFFAPPARFAARLELPAPVLQAEHALFAARRLLTQMEGFLAARHAGVRAFSLELVHDGPPATVLQVGFAAPGRSAEHFARLLRERLGALTLRSPVEAIGLDAGDLENIPGQNKNFFDDRHTGAEEWLRLVERLQARLGSEAVHGLETHPDHRPERAFRHAGFESNNSNRTQKQSETFAPRPLWLLESPRRLAEGEFTLLAGPERIESGWWDGAEARRDYFIARSGASLAWVYREREGNWFLHGLFA